MTKHKRQRKEKKRIRINDEELLIKTLLEIKNQDRIKNIINEYGLKIDIINKPENVNFDITNLIKDIQII